MSLVIASGLPETVAGGFALACGSLDECCCAPRRSKVFAPYPFGGPIVGAWLHLVLGDGGLLRTVHLIERLSPDVATRFSFSPCAPDGFTAAVPLGALPRS